ncbi:hypothetical protein ON010_g212 [Phytophthora cinnamomi]|nr:hypothetical protein ON010_g212 [Phytophthora cinnamomi]
MASKGSDEVSDDQRSERDDALERYVFVPEPLRHHFKVERQLFADEVDNQDEQQLVRRARQTRSARLVADLFSQPPPPALTQFIYSNAIERAITARMTFTRALEGLEKYFDDVAVRVKQFQAQHPGGTFDTSSMKIPTLVQTQRQIVNVCQGCLSDCDIYLGMYEALPSPPAASSTPVVRFVACSTKSSMLYRTLECPPVQLLQGHTKSTNLPPDEASTGPFSCFPLLGGDPGEDATVIGVLSVDACRKARHFLPQAMSVEALHAFLLRMQLRDAAVELKKARFDGARFLALTEIDLRHKTSFQHLKVATKNRLLELIRSLLKGSRIHLPNANERALPFTEDDDALEFLDGVAKLSGRFLASYRHVHWIREIANITRNPACTAYDVYDVLIRAITRSMESLERVAIWKISNRKDKTSAEELQEWEIDVIASTAVPDDRVEPFLNGLDRKVKQIALYKENEDAIRSSQKDGGGKCVRLMRGGIINIIPNATASTVSRHSNLPCENALYHLSWSDRSLQSVPWNQLRQLLPIRNMNAKHFQLRQLCHRLQAEETDEQQQQHSKDADARPMAIKIDNPNGFALIVRDNSRPTSVRYVLEVDFAGHFEPPSEICNFLEQAVSVAEQALKCVRGREARHSKRKLAVAKNSLRFQSIGLNPSGDALRALQDIVSGIFDDVADSLPDVHMQISELQANGAQLKYTFTGNGSTVLGCTLNRGQGVSFVCLDTKQPLVVGPASNLRSRLQRIGVLRNQPEVIEEAFPFIFVPLIHEDSAIGVLSVDSFQNVPKGRPDEAHPEAGILEFLVPLSKLLASAIYAKRRSYALHQIQLACQEPLRSPQQLLFYACRALKDVMVGVCKVRVVEIDGIRGKTTLVYDFSESEREQARSWLFNVVRPMAFRWKELCTDTIGYHLQRLYHDEEENSDSVIKLLAAIRGDEEEHQKVVVRYQQLTTEEKDAPANAPRRSAVETEKFKLFERQTADKYFMLLSDSGDGPLVLMEDFIPEADRLSSEKYIAHAMKLFLGTATGLYSDIHAMARPASKIFLTVSAVPQFHAACDQVYLQRVTSITSKYMTALQERVTRSRERIVALNQFRDMCQKVLTSDAIEAPQSTMNDRGGRYRHKVSPANEVEGESLLHLQRDSIALIERSLNSPNVYFGMWEPALRILRYTSASKASIMAGKKLKHGHGVSFLALEKQIPVVVTSRDAANDEGDDAAYVKKLRYFTNEPFENRKWPFIAVPLGNLGVLALDNMESYEREAQEQQPEVGVVDFLRKIGQGFAEVLTVIRERTMQDRQRLRDEALVRVMSACENFKPTSSATGTVSLYLPHLVIQQIENALNGVDVYIGMVEPLCERIRFVCASSNSKMGKRTVDTHQSLSFRAFASQRTIVIPQLQQYFKQQKVLQQHDTEHGQKLKYFGRAENPQGPFVCIPIPFVGVLSVDTFPGAAGGVFSPTYPEDGVVTFLEKVANCLGENVRTMAANDAKKLLPTVFYGQPDNIPLVSQANSSDIQSDEATKTLLKPVQQLSGCPETLVVHCSSTRDVDSDEAALIPTVLVLHRVKGATWMYDEEFLSSILQLINTLIALVNVRVEGIVARRLAERKMREMCLSLDSLPSTEAIDAMYATILPNAMEMLAQAMSRDNADVYLGQRELTDRSKSRVSQLQLRFVAASGRSQMKCVAVNLEEEDNLSLTVVQCLKTQQSAVVPLSHEGLPVRQLSAKSAQRVFITFPMGDNYVLCADSLGHEAFVPGKRHLVEPDILLFIKRNASILQDTILSTRHRLSYDRLRSLTTRPHTDFRLFYTTILDGLRRDLVNLHSQQIVTLGEDFTAAFRLEAWQRECTRRPMKTLPEHFCSVNGCEKLFIEHEIHSEAQLHLPMTNVPRTLDMSRAHMQPTEGTEKHGMFTCGCLATMLDTSAASQQGDAKLALCVFSHDAKASESQNNSRMMRRSMMPPDYGDSTAFFTNYQRQYFFAFAAVVSDVYAHVFRACALETFATELFMTLQEYLDAKDGVVIRFDYNDHNKEVGSEMASTTTQGEDIVADGDGYGSTTSTTSKVLATTSLVSPVVLFSQQPGKVPSRQSLRGRLERKAQQFEASNAPLTIFMTKKAIPAPPTKDPTDRTKGTPTSKAKGAQDKTSKRKGPMSLFGGRKLFRYCKDKKREEEGEKAEEQKQLMKAATELQSLSPSRAQQLQREIVSLHVFLRVLDYQGRRDIIIFTVEKQSIKAVSGVEKLTRHLRGCADNFASEMIAKPPRGNEEVNAKRFCSGADRGGGGFLVLSLLKRAQTRFQDVETLFGGAMRQYLTGAQGTARDSRTNVSESLTALFGNVSTKDDSLDSTTTPTIALLRVTLVACSLKREAIMSLSQPDLLKEYLRVQAGRKLLQLDPTDRKTWGPLGRARALLRTFESVIHDLGLHPGDDLKGVGTKSEAKWALLTLLDLLLAQSAIVRYLKHLESEIARERRQFGDAPAIMIQCFTRQTQARVELKKRRLEFHAALAIQCAFRQHLARRRVLFMKCVRAAIKVQRAYRRKRQRAKGSRPQRFTAQLLSASQKYGGMGRSPSVAAQANLDGAWQTDMAAFGSFQDFVASKVGREQIKKEEELMWRHRRELERERARLPRDEALREDVDDLFELLDEAGSGELSRDRTAALITRLHVPLNEEEVADVVAMMDSDGSGGISIDEFMRWFAHEFPLLQKRAPRACGVVTRRDWQWVIEQSARSAILKRWRAMRAGAIATAPGGSRGHLLGGDKNVPRDAIREEDDDSIGEEAEN